MIALPGGLPLYIGYQDVEVVSPDGLVTLTWRFVTEPPWGDGLFTLSLNDCELPGRYWGRGHAWSPESDYFCVEHYDQKGESSLVVVRVSDGKWWHIASSASVERFVYPHIEFHPYGATKVVSYTFIGSERWQTPRQVLL